MTGVSADSVAASSATAATTIARPRGPAMVRRIIGEERRSMQARAYERARPYLAGAMRRLRRAYPAFLTVVFDAERADFAFVFGDGTQGREAPKAFAGLRAACRGLSQMAEIEQLTAGDALWQVCRGGPQPEVAVEQYRHVEDEAWHRWCRCSLREARYHMRRAIYSRTVHGSHRAGFGKRIVADDGDVVDEWVDPVEPTILRALREAGAPLELGALCRRLDAIRGFQDGHYCWDVLRACERLEAAGAVRSASCPWSPSDGAQFALASAREPLRGLFGEGATR